MILSPEYEQFIGNLFHGSPILLDAVDIYPDNIDLLNIQQFWQLFLALPRHSIGKTGSFCKSLIASRNPVGAYHRTSFNLNGDMVNHWNLPSQKIKVKQITRSYNKRLDNQLV